MLQSTIRVSIYKDLPSYILENDRLSVEMVPSLGGKLASIKCKSTEKEWLLDSGTRQLKRLEYGSNFKDADMSGWDECFPTIKACHDGVFDIPDHGEIWSLPWEVTITDCSIIASVTNPRNSYRFIRSLEFQDSNKLLLRYKVLNTSESAFSFLWAAHPQFNIDEPTQIMIPKSVTELVCVYSNQIKQVNSTYRVPSSWIVESLCNGSGEKYYFPEIVPEAWAGLYGLDSNNFIMVKTDKSLVPSFGIWIDQGAVNDRTTIALEPGIGYYDVLTRAKENGTAPYIEPNQSYNWQLELEVGHE